MKQITVINQANNDSFTFYDSSNGVILQSFSGFEYSMVRPVIDDISGQQSAVYLTSKFGKRIISWSGDLLNDTVFTLRRQMLQPMRQSGVLKLIKFTTYDDLALQCEGEITKVVAPYNHSVQSFLIEATCPDWRFYSQTQTVANSNSSSQTITNNGTEKTDPVFRIYGPGTLFTITNTTTAEQFIINATLLNGDYIDIDIKARTIIKNGSTSLYSSFSGSFFSLIPGNNVISFVVTGSGPGFTLVTTYRDAYLGI